MVRVAGTDITISAVYKLGGDATPQVRHMFQNALKAYFNDVSFFDCINVTSGAWRHEFQVQSHGQDLLGEGRLDYLKLQAKGCGFSTKARSGDFSVVGVLLDSVSRGKANEGDLGYLMELDFQYSLLPSQKVGPSELTIAQGFFKLAAAETLWLRMLGPDGTTITNAPRLSAAERSVFPPCTVIDYKLDSDRLEITAVEPFQDHAVNNAMDNCWAYTSPADYDRGCN